LEKIDDWVQIFDDEEKKFLDKPDKIKQLSHKSRKTTKDTV
jgi:hypothetical protein